MSWDDEMGERGKRMEIHKDCRRPAINLAICSLTLRYSNQVLKVARRFGVKTSKVWYGLTVMTFRAAPLVDLLHLASSWPIVDAYSSWESYSPILVCLSSSCRRRGHDRRSHTPTPVWILQRSRFLSIGSEWISEA
jgi:hypothetical protein